LWRGVVTSMMRMALSSAAQLTTYHWLQQKLEYFRMLPRTSTLNTFIASSFSGASTVVFTTPFDVVSTRMQSQKTDVKGKGKLYTSTFDCFGKIVQKEGVLGLYKGWGASFLRIGPHAVLLLVIWNGLMKFSNDTFRAKKEEKGPEKKPGLN